MLHIDRINCHHSIIVMLAAVLLAALCCGTSLAQPTSVTLLNYHNQPPFVLDQQTDLSQALAQWLTAQADGVYDFKVLTVPRERLNIMLHQGHQGVVMWANPNWFNEFDAPGLMTTVPLLKDRNVVVSNRDQPINYLGPQSLVGHQLALVRGYQIVAIDTLVREGKIERYDVNREDNALLMVARARGMQATIMSEIVARFIARELELVPQLYVAPQAHSEYTRHLLVTEELPDVASFLKEQLPILLNSAEWEHWSMEFQLLPTPP